MANSMDTILVKYLGSKDAIPIRDFIYPEKPLNLTETEHKIQEATRLVYELNEKDPPLYKNFNNRNPKKPLTINCSDAESVRNANAYYHPAKNEVCFVSKYGDLTLSLVHELKHAEQNGNEELLQIENGHDNKAKKENWLMNEVDSFYTEIVACAELGQGEPVFGNLLKLYQNPPPELLNEKGQKDIPKIKQHIMAEIFRTISSPFGERSYLKQTELYFPVLDSDEGLKKMPKHYGLTDEFLSILNEVPKEAQTNAGKIHQHYVNHRENQIPELHIPREDRASALNDLFYRLSQKDIPELHSLMTLQDTDGKPFFDEESKLSVISKAPEYGKVHFQLVHQFFQDDQQRLPFTQKDFITEKGNRLLQGLDLDTPTGRVNVTQVLPEMLEMKGSDGQPLIREKDLIDRLPLWSVQMRTPENLQTLLDGMKDEKGNLPLTREVFDIRDAKDKSANGGNCLLTRLLSEYQSSAETQKMIKALGDSMRDQFEQTLDNLTSLEYCLRAIPILMSLKDKDRKPIISQENIDKFPEHNPLTSAVKAYKRTGIQQSLQVQAKAGAKSLETEPKGYVKKGAVTTAKSPKVPSPKINPSKGDFSL